MTRMEVIIRDRINDCSLCMLENLFSLGIALSLFLAVLKIRIQLFCNVSDFLLLILSLVVRETCFTLLLPENSGFVLGLVSGAMIG